MTRTTSLATALWMMLGCAAGAAAAGEPTWYGGIEVGSKGIKMVAIPYDADGRLDLAHKLEAGTGKKANADPARQVEGLKKQTADVGLVIRDKDGNFRTQTIQDAGAAVAAFHEFLRVQKKVKPENLWVVASSGLISQGKPRNFDALEAAIFEATNKEETLAQITQETEVRLMIRGAIPKEDLSTSILLDIGGGNSKVGYFQPASALSKAGYQVLPSKIEGSSSFEAAIKKEMAKGPTRDFAGTAERLRKDRAATILDDIGGKAGLLTRRKVYVSGGVVWAIALLNDPESVVSEDIYIPFSLPKLKEFRARLLKAKAIEKPDLDALPKELKEKAEVEVNNALDLFSHDALLAGSEMLLAFSEALEFEEQQKELEFTKSGVVAWIIGFVEKARARQQAAVPK